VKRGSRGSSGYAAPLAGSRQANRRRVKSQVRYPASRSPHSHSPPLVLRPSPITLLKVFPPTELMWALIGLILTIGGTFLEAFITNAPWDWGNQGLHTYSLGVTYQIGGVLLVGCLGGRNAAAISQIAYLLLGLTWMNVFAQGGGFDYIQQPTFGYLLGFVPAAWICGELAFRVPVRLESLSFSCLVGLLTVHIMGLGYLIIAYLSHWITPTLSLLQSILTYSIYPLPGQLAIVCAVTVIAFVLRHIMFY
jgi:biotin transport system substrate-specific component